MHYYQHHIGDYDAATLHLSWDEDIAYRRLLCIYYRDERPIPLEVDKACRLVRAKSAKQRAAIQRILDEFFEKSPDGWTHRRCDRELQKFHEKIQKTKNAAKISVRARATKKAENSEKIDVECQQTVSKRSTDVELTINHQPLTAPTTLNPSEAGGGGDGEMDNLDQLHIADRLSVFGVATAHKTAAEALRMRPFETVIAILDYYETTFWIDDGNPGGISAFEKGPGYLAWRITSDDCREDHPAKAWKLPDNPKFSTLRQTKRSDASRASAVAAAAMTAKKAADSRLEKDFGPAVDRLTWDEALPLLKDEFHRRYAMSVRAGPDPPGKHFSIRTVLLSALSSQSQGDSVDGQESSSKKTG